MGDPSGRGRCSSCRFGESEIPRTPTQKLPPHPSINQGFRPINPTSTWEGLSQDIAAVLTARQAAAALCPSVTADCSGVAHFNSACAGPSKKEFRPLIRWAGIRATPDTHTHEGEVRSCPRSFGGGDPTLTLRVRFHNFSRSDLMTLCIALQSYFWDDSVRFQSSNGKCSDLATGPFRLTLRLRPIHM